MDYFTKIFNKVKRGIDIMYRMYYYQTMLVKRISTQEARANFSELLGSVYYTNNPVIVERKGKPFAVVISPEQYEGFKREQEKAWAAIDQIQERNQDKNSNKVLSDVTKVVEQVRQERYDKLQRKAVKNSY